MNHTHHSHLKRCSVKLCCLAGAAVLLATPIAALAAEQGSIAEKLTVNIQQACPSIAGLGPDGKEVREFTHALHAEKYLKGKSNFSAIPYSDDFTCAACHLGAKAPADITGTDKCARLADSLAPGGGAAEYKKQIHGICMDCHKNMAKANEKTGPVKCADCHGK